MLKENGGERKPIFFFFNDLHANHLQVAIFNIDEKTKNVLKSTKVRLFRNINVNKNSVNLKKIIFYEQTGQKLII